MYADTSEVFTDMYDNQLELQTNVFGNGTQPADYPDKEKMDYIRTMVLALENELHEFLGETGWKTWAKSNHVNEEAAQGELVDAWHFFMNLMFVARMDMTDLVTGYWNKQQKNRDRQTAGYDGRAEKCPVCKRGLDDDAVFCEVTKINAEKNGRLLNQTVVRCFA